MTRDTYNVGRAGAVGPGATASNTTFIESRASPLEGIDLAMLSVELAQLKLAMQAAASSTAHYAALTAISEAEDAAMKNDTSTVASRLKAAGSWAFDTATKIGVSVASKAIQVAVGLP